jgi:mannosyltransferase OCH1-like enzyme
MKTQVKKKSTYDLEERLDALCSMRAKLYDYRHVFEDDDRLCEMVQSEINDIVNELEKREQNV